MGRDWQGKLSPLLYVVGIASSFSSWVSGAYYVVVALIWLAPDPRIEKVIAEASQ